jgi:serine phosphatase RsbU (regulator of sigma subunit)/anti-sigma regulatory factor (Ser/Thr protein kinase)
VAGSLTESAESGIALLRRLSAAIADALTADEVVRATLTTALEMPGVGRAGIALNSAGGRQLQFVSTDVDALTPTRVRWCLIDAFSDVPLVDAVRHGEDVYARTIPQLAERYPGVAARQRELGTESLAALSLATEAENVGGLMLSFESEQRFDAEQRWFFSAFAAQVTQALRKGLAYQIKHTTAEQLQRSLMPRSLPDLPGLDLGSYYRPGGLNSDVGGDWYDVIDLANGRTAVVLGDVMGKGAPAAIVMSEIRAALRAYAVLDASPSSVLTRLDAYVASRSGTEQIVTVAYGVISRDRRTVTLALAGHPPPVVLSDDGATAVLAEGTGSALGVGAGPWPETTVGIGPGSLLVLYSDGLVEKRNRELDAGIAELVHHLDGIPRRRRQPRELCARIAQLMTDDHAEDDVTLLSIAVTSASRTQRAAAPLPADALAPRVARRFLRDTLRDWGVEDDTIEAAELCVSELVTNAVIHTGTSSEVTAQLDQDFLTVMVRDGGGIGSVRRVAAAPEDPLMVSGRGLGLVEALTTAWSAEHGADGTTVWFEIERPTAS